MDNKISIAVNILDVSDVNDIYTGISNIFGDKCRITPISSNYTAAYLINCKYDTELEYRDAIINLVSICSNNEISADYR